MKLTTLVVGAVFLLAGCAPTPEPVVDRQVGDCWSVDGSKKMEDIHGTNQASATCDSSATAATFLVGTVVGAPAKSYLSRGFLEASTIAELPDRMIRQVTDECEAGLEDLFGGMNVLALRQLRVATSVTFPSVEQWNEGERWFSCETSLRKWGSPLAQPEWQSLPSPLSKLADDVAARPAEYRLCVDTTLNSILPTAAQGVVSDCTTARWALKPVSLGVTFGEIYPGTVKAKALASERCRAANPGALAVSAPLVTKFEWQAPRASAMCWVSTTPDPVASPTPTPEPETPTPIPAPRRIVPVEPEVTTEPEVPAETVVPVEPTTDPITPTDPPV